LIINSYKIHRALKQPVPVAASAAPLLPIQKDVISSLVKLGAKRTAAEKAVRAASSEDATEFDALFRTALQTVQKGAAA
jgi:hypothetical protein